METPHMVKRLAGSVVALVLAGGLLAACSSGSSSSTTVTTVTPTTGTTPTTGAVSSTSTTRGTTTTTTGPISCPASALAGSIHGSSGAAGTIETTIALKLVSSRTCVLGGYPGLQMLDSNGAKLTTTVVRKGNYSFTAMPATTVTLTTGQSVYFNMGYSDVPTGSETSCPMSASLEITPPNAFGYLTIAAELGPCNNGTIAVSPVFQATGANAATMAP
jgi:hypothetical protein